MNEPCLTLVADDSRLAAALLDHLGRTLGLVAWHCPFDAVRGYPEAGSGGPLVLATASAADSERVRRLVQEIHLRQKPAVLLIVETDAARAESDLTGLDPYVARRLGWPGEAAVFGRLLRQRLGRLPPRPPLAQDSVEEVVRRRLMSQTPSLAPLVERIALASRHDVTVLLTGETGAGKSFLARLLHDCSPRKAQPFLTVPCGAQPPTLLESAFFGHVRGAFTGADRPKVGKFEAAGEGTILLDEIDTIPLEQQAGLLRVIETGEFEPVGGVQTKRSRARVIAASNENLEDGVRRGRFRKDLYYRLTGMAFHVPPLCERVQDVGPLARAMAARFNTRFGKDLFDIGADALDALECFPWPGNIRQLENVLQQAVLVSSGPELRLEHLPEEVRRHYQDAAGGPPERPGANRLAHKREVTEQNLIRRALASHGYSRSRAAASLGVSRITLYKKMKKYGLMREPMRPELPL